MFYRLNVIPFEVPPLRERREDIPLLTDYFNLKYSAQYARSPKFFTDDARTRLSEYDWPGNVRELRNTIERVVIMSGRDQIAGEDLPPLGTLDALHSPTTLAVVLNRHHKYAVTRVPEHVF